MTKYDETERMKELIKQLMDEAIAKFLENYKVERKDDEPKSK